MREIIIRVRRRNHSDTVQVWAELTDGPSVLVLERARDTAQWKSGPGEDLGPQEMWELICAIRNEIEGWSAKLPLDY